MNVRRFRKFAGLAAATGLAVAGPVLADSSVSSRLDAEHNCDNA